MKKLFFFKCALMGLVFFLVLNACFSESLASDREHVTYYINAEKGDDSNHGHSPGRAFKTLERLRSVVLGPGDQVLLAAGQEFSGSLILKDVSGTKGHPIRVSSYPEGKTIDKPLINAAGYANAVLLENCSYVEIENLMLVADGGGMAGNEAAKMRCGLLVKTSREGEFTDIRLENLKIKDIFYEDRGFERPAKEVRSSNGTQRYGWGIRVINNTKNALLSRIEVLSCTIENVSHTGIKFTSRIQGEKSYGIRDITISGNEVLSVGGPGIQISRVSAGYISENIVDGSGSNDDSRKWGRGSGLWTWSSSDILIEKNKFLNAKGPADSAGAHIDFNCRNIVLQFNLSVNNAGGFCEILGNNHNCAYRYNVSINDGYRVKGENGAFQEGKIFWLSGYTGRKHKKSGPFNSYFYNNTIFVSHDIVAKFAVNNKTASGILIANNIFYIEGSSKSVLGDQYNPDRGGKTTLRNGLFENNLYFKHYSWPEDMLLQDAMPILGDPRFRNAGGFSVEDYIPANTDLVKDRGITIGKIPGDTAGISIGLEVTHDILGNEIKDAPDMGAIEIR